MQVLSAAEAVTPAIHRTRDFLFRPFRWTTFLKLCAVGVLTEGFSGNFNSSTGHHGVDSSSAGAQTVSYSPAALAQWIPVIAAVAIVALAIGVVIFYLITRLRFALFHCLVYQTREIRPGWRLYQAQAWRFFLLNIAVGVVYIVLAALLMVPFVLSAFHMYRSIGAGNRADLAAIVSLVLPLIAVILLLILVAIAVDIVLRDLMLPHMALENASAGAAWAAARVRIAAEKGRFLLYGFLRIALPLAAFVAVVLVLIIPMVIVFGGLALALVGLHSLIAGATGVSHILLIVGEAVLILAAVVLGILIALCVGGPVSIGVRNYALLFYGGRYQALGDILFPPPPPVVFGGVS